MNASLLVLSIATLAATPQQDVLYDFYGTHCPPCQMMMPIVDRLQSEGLPVVKINVDERPDLRSQFGVDRWPTFILVVGGREQQRLVGWQSESTLRAMLASIPRRTSPAELAVDSSPMPRSKRTFPIRLAEDETSKAWDFHLPLPRFSGGKSQQSKSQAVVQIDPPNQPGGFRPRETADAQQSNMDSVPPSDDENASSGSEFDAFLSTSVRIRVKDSAGAFFGSGVVISSVPGKTIVLTCGHILRDVKRDSRMEVDVFDGKNSRTYPGAILKYNLNADVGLVEIPTPSVVSASTIASLEEGIRANDSVVSIGCSGGRLPTVERLRVTMLNRYQGPDTIECTGVPALGRSGGGLFTNGGRVVGICTNADPKEGRGVYAGLKPIHQLLQSAGLESLIPGGRKSHRDALAETPTEPPSEPTNGQLAADETATSKLELELAQMSKARGRRSRVERQQELAANPVSAEESIPAPELEAAEVVCIIHPRNQPSRVVIINRASRKFLAYLNGEKDRLVPTMVQSSGDPLSQSNASTATSDSDRSRETDGAGTRDNSARITAVWKPTVSAR